MFDKAQHEYAVANPGIDAPLAAPQAVPETESQKLMQRLDELLPPLLSVCWEKKGADVRIELTST